MRYVLNEGVMKNIKLRLSSLTTALVLVASSLSTAVPFIFDQSANAAVADHVVINEVLPNPSSGTEFVELYNPTADAVSIGGFEVKDTADNVFGSIPASQSIDSHGFYILEDSSTLNNDTDTIQLLDASDGEQDSFTYTGSNVDKSYAAIPDGDVSNITADNTPTPNATNDPASTQNYSFTVNGASTFTKDVAKEFTVTTSTNDSNGDGSPKVKAYFDDNGANGDYEYKDPSGNFQSFDGLGGFGPAEGFEYQDGATSTFRAKYPTTGDYTAHIKFREVGTYKVIAEDNVAFSVTNSASAVTNTRTDENFDTIQQAIADSDTIDNDTIKINSSVLTEGPQIIISKSITLVGDGIDATTIKADGDTARVGDARGWFFVPAGESFSANNLTFDGNGHKIWQAVRNKGSGGTFDKVRFSDIRYFNNGSDGSPYGGTGLAAFGSGPVDVTNSKFENIGRIGTHYFGSGVNGSKFTGNTYTGKGAGNFLDYALDIGAGAQVDVSDNDVSNNKGVASSSDGSTSAGFLVTTFFGAGTEATFTNNQIHDNTTGIAVGFDSADTSVVAAHQNNIVNNDNGISNTNTANNVDAADNWWNSDTGPSGAGSPGTGDSVSDGVTYEPWLCQEYTGQVNPAVSNAGSCTPPNTSGPTLSNTTAADGSTVGGTFTVSTEATDTDGVQSVSLQFEGSSNSQVYQLTHGSGNTWSAQVNSKDFESGTGNYTLKFAAVDGLGKSRSNKATHYTIDNTSPVIQVLSLSDNDLISDTVNIRVKITDDSSGVKSAYLKFLVGGNTDASSSYGLLPVGGDIYEASVNTKDFAPSGGVFTLKVVARDNAGNSRSNKSITGIQVDNARPTMSNLKFYVKNSSDAYIEKQFVKAGDNVRVKVQADDNVGGSGIGYVQFKVKSVGGDILEVETPVSVPVSGNLYQFDFQIPSDGQYHVNTNGPITEATDGLLVAAKAYDNAGNSVINALKQNFTYDNTAPNTVLAATIKQNGQDLSCGAFTKFRTITVDWNDDQDANFDHYNYQNIDGGTIKQPTASQFTGDIRDQDGYYQFRVQAVDKAGNTGPFSNWCGITLDRAAPAAPTLLSPGDGVPVKGANLTNDWTDVTDADHYIYESYNVNGDGTCNLSTLRFTTTYTASQTNTRNVGDLTFCWRVSAVDTAGNQSPWSELWKTVVDNTAPTANITSATQASKDVVSFEGFVNDTNLSHYYCYLTDQSGSEVGERGDNCVTTWAKDLQRNGNPATSTNQGDGSASSPVTLGDFDISGLNSGDYTVKLVAIDRAGNQSATATHNVTIDHTAPVITVGNPTLTADDTMLKFGGTVDDPTAAVNIGIGTQDYTAANDGSGTWLVIITPPLAVGTYDITATATDPAGNVGQDTGELQITAPPSPDDDDDGSGGNDRGSINRSVITVVNSTNQNASTGSASVFGNTIGGNASSGNASNTSITENQVLAANTNDEPDGSVQSASTPANDFASATTDAGQIKSSGKFLGLGWWWLPLVSLIAPLGFLVRKFAF